MILHRNRLIFGIIKKILRVVLGTVYHILALFNLQLTALILLIGIVLYLTGALDSNSAFKIVYELILIASVVLAIVTTVRKLLGLNKKKNDKVKRSKGAQIIEDDNAPIIPPPAPNYASYTAPVPPPVYNEPTAPIIPVEHEKPMYYRVKQNPEYVMAEYSDRYELFKIVGGGLKKVRTDYK